MILVEYTLTEELPRQVYRGWASGLSEKTRMIIHSDGRVIEIPSEKLKHPLYTNGEATPAPRDLR